MAEKPPQPGWYPDPASGSGLRYWDGSAWGPVAPPPQPPPARRGSGVLPGFLAGISPFVLIILLPLFCCGGCGVLALIGAFSHHSPSSSDQSTSATTQAYTPPPPRTFSEAEIESAVVRTCQDGAKKQLKDPDSAKFGDDWKAWIVTHSDQPPSNYHPENGDQLYSAAGSVNAKNGFGGYTGAQMWACDAVVTPGEDGKVSARAYPLT